MAFAIVGHRGVMAHKPENSLESYAAAEAIGVDEIELDVRVSRDGHLFLLHDDTLDRTAAHASGRGRGPVAAMTLAEIQSVELDSGRGVPTLAEMYDATSTFVQLEIKDPAVVPLLPDFFATRPAAAARTMITGFDAHALQQAAELLPHVLRGIIVSSLPKAQEFPGGWEALLDYTQSNRFHCGFEGLGTDVIDSLHARGMEVHVWPVRTEEDMQRAVRLGVDGTTSDDPAVARAWHADATSNAH